ncbi:tyrosine-protein phosphatase [Bdellovibrio sp. HCB2-146]|uniref:tyrosine-protein phosphatase n=1 Tax=Bdellovibrio sp. HCB2-146 TaxID=3394362 RepID=UPI0039BC894D
MKTLLLLSLLTSLTAHAYDLNNRVQGLTIPNSHVVTYSDSQQVLRGRTPTEDQMQELIDIGVRKFLIFKNDVKGEVSKEVSSLKKLGVRNEDITHVPFPWKDITDFRSACEMTIAALQTIESAHRQGESIYFHCTAGEDRTGYLASLWSLWSGARTSAQESFQEDMCNNGYEAGNPNKPYKTVVVKIRETLTPTYIRMLIILANAKKAGLPLRTSLCDSNPNFKSLQSKFVCQ